MSNENNHFSDEVIVTTILNGDVQEFALLVKNTEQLVAQIVRKMVSNEDDQKDLVQDIYLKAYKNLPGFQFNAKLSTWIATIAYNTTVNYLQKKRIPIIGMEQTQEHFFATTDNSEQRTIKREAIMLLQTAIAQLPPLYRTLITLYHLEELSIKEITEITQLPEGTIKSYLSRARKTLKDAMNDHYNTEER